MARSPALFLLIALTSSCGTVGSLETAISYFSGARVDSTVFEPGLLGTWELIEEGTIVGRAVVTRTGPVEYRVQHTTVENDSTAYYSGIVGRFGPKRLLLELSPLYAIRRGADSSRSRDSIDFETPSGLILVPVNVHFVIEQADSGLSFFVFDTDSLNEALESGQIVASYWTTQAGYSRDVLLTSREADSVMSVLRQFAARPGALIPFPRIGRTISWP